MEIQERVKSYEEAMLNDLATLVSYNSVQGEPQPDAPFGEVPAACLDKALEIAEGYGFAVKNVDHYAGYAEIGEGEQVIGVLAHLDVVPAGEGWKTDPFTLTRDGDRVYGRGTSDDKGAVVASMIAMKVLKDMNVPLTKRIRLILGTNEETGSKCLAHYVEKEGHIDMGFTPDGTFPGVHGEKGALGLDFESIRTQIKEIRGGVASNVVCNHCTMIVASEAVSEEALRLALEKHPVTFEIKPEQGDLIVDVYGTAAHASTPKLGVNAIGELMAALAEAGMQDDFVEFYNRRIGTSCDGAGCDCQVEDEYGPLTFSNGIIKMENGVIRGTIDIRFPVTMNSRQIASRIEAALAGETQGKITVRSQMEPLFFPIDSPLVSRLLQAYQEVTGDLESKPITMGGGTYAKGIHNCIAFGCEFMGEDCHIHDANEFVRIDCLLQQAEIYVHALMKLLEA